MTTSQKISLIDFVVDLRLLIDLASITKFDYLLTMQRQLQNLIHQREGPAVS